MWLERLRDRLKHRHRLSCSQIRAPRPCFCVLEVAPAYETCLAVARTEAQAFRDLGSVIDGFRDAGYMLVWRSDRHARMSVYLRDLDIFVETDLVVEYIHDARRRGLPHRALWPLRRKVVVRNVVSQSPSARGAESRLN